MKARAAGLVALAALFGAAAAGAQNPTPPRKPFPVPRPAPADTARAPAPDTGTARGVQPADATGRAAPADTGRARRDTVPVPDSLSPDTFRTQLPRLGAPPGPLPAAGRVVFDRDALWYSGALTLGELLQRIPGVFLARAGWFGRPEVVHYAGQGASSVQVFWDGFAMDPIGRDSAGLNLGQIDLGLLQRVEVEVLPTGLRVYLFSDGQTIRRARTETSFAAGDASTNTYRIRYLNRWKDGAGLGLGVDFLGTASGRSDAGHTSDLTLWAKGSWVPTPRYGVEYQLISASTDYQAFQATSAAGSAFDIGDPKSHRTDAFVRGFVASRDDGMGLRLDALVGSTSYTDSIAALSRDELQGAAIVAYRAEHWSSELTARVRDNSTPFEVQWRGAVSPLAAVTASLTADEQLLTGSRHSRDLAAGLEWHPWRALTLHGAARYRDAVASPAVVADTAQRVTDLTAGITLSSGFADLDASFTRHGGYAAPVYGTFDTVVPAYPSLPVRTATVSFALRPTRFFTLAGWYREPLDPVTSAYEPPHHSRISTTFRTRLLPVLRRNAFDFTAEVTAEAWSHGAAGVDGSGNPVRLPGAVVVEYRVQVKLVNAALFWTMRNALNEHYALVPGVQEQTPGQRYGIRWEFTN